MITYDLEITSLECVPSLDGLTNVVAKINWTYTGTQDNEKNYRITGTTPVPTPTPEVFTPYEDLTFEIVEGWLNTIVDFTAYQTGIESQINTPEVQPNVILPLPN